MNTPLYNKLSRALPEHRFHTPGHKGNLGGIFSSVAKYDLTEISLTDNLFFPENEILGAEALASALFGSKTTVFSAAGATLCIQTALSLFAGKTVLFERNIHISAVNASILCGINPIFCTNDISEFGYPFPMTAEKIEKALLKTPASAVFLTSPNYYGLCADIPKIKRVCERFGAALIVDNSHGTHMKFTHDGIDAHCADIVIDSAHKTLPCLTGGAYLHFMSDFGPSYAEIKSKMLLFGSTSPSFLILASLDYARGWCEENKGEFLKTAKKVADLKANLEACGIHIADAEIYDPLRLCVTCGNAESVNSELENSGIYAEMCDGNSLVFLFSPFNSDTDFAVLEKALINLCEKTYNKGTFVSFEPELCTDLKTAFFGKKAELPIEQTVGKTCAKAVIPYPPGVPVLLPGEKIKRETVEYLRARYGYNSLWVLSDET